MKTKIFSLLMSILVLFQIEVFSDDNAAGVSHASHSFTPATGISIGTWAIAVTSMFLFDKVRMDRQRGDSIISFFDSVYNRDLEFYNTAKYDSCNTGLNALLSGYTSYSHYVKKRHRILTVYYDTLNRYIEKSKLLGSLFPAIEDMNLRSDSLPDNDYDVLNADRRVLDGNISLIRTRINEFVARNIRNEDVVRYGFRHALVKLDLVDSLIREVYQEQKGLFNVKCKYFYNRAVESGDTSRIRDFVDDCNYYQIDKEWCTRARLLIEPPPVTVSMVEPSKETESSPVIKKMTQADSVNMDYLQVINSGRIDLLEGYISRYSKKKYSKYGAKLDSVKVAFNLLSKKIEAEKQYNLAHPLLSNGDFSRVETFYKGLSDSAETIFKNILSSSEQEFKSISGFRFPVSVSVDYTTTPPILMIHAYVHCPNDIDIKKNDSSVVYSIQGINSSIDFLNGLKKSVAAERQSTNAHEADLIKKAVFIVRLAKSPQEYVTFYGKNTGSKPDSDSTDFYPFFDFTIKNYKDIRFDNQFSPEIRNSRIEKDTLKQVLGQQFFE